MKKTQVALAALALVASTAAMAEVTVYGRLDASLQKESGRSASVNGEGNWDTSVFGFRGSEDLGSGLKASFNLETGLNIANGNISNRGTDGLFARLANVGLSSDAMGSLTVGTQLSPYIAAALGGVANNNESFYVPLLILAGDRTAQPFGAGGATAGATSSGFFIPNSVSYTTPTIGGVSASVLSTLSASDDTNKYTAARVSFAANALSANFGYHKRGTTGVTGLNNYDGYSITAAYQVSDVLRVAGGYHQNENNVSALKTKTYNIGASYNVTDATAASVQYARNDAADAGSIINVGLITNLSKRTYAYVTASRAQNGAATTYGLRDGGLNTAALGATQIRSSTQDATGYAVGIGHNF